ncbi:MAG: hypothetical protein U9R37_06475 [Campylobacterota bacterium]|nr:hypothetical protein [Campylobacterota bacterium]
MYIINVEKECGCFKKSSFKNDIKFKLESDAIIASNKMVDDMNNNFCGKHSFKAKQDGKNFIISVTQNS